MVGQLAQEKNSVFFEYHSDFLVNPYYLSPFKLTPEKKFHEHKDTAFGPIFGLFDDSLPDGWGLLLMDRFMRKKGIIVSEISVLDRLAFLGSSTMGALTYEPPFEKQTDKESIFDIGLLAQHSRKIIKGESDIVIPQLIRAGGSPGGACPKVLVGVYKDHIISGEDDLPENYEHWIIKFSAKDDLLDSGPVEYAYSLMAKAATIKMTETKLFKSQEDQFFGIKRFDRKGNRRFHVHTFGNLIHSNFRIPSCDYEQFLKVIKILTGNHQDVKRGFTQMIFNVLANNRDDHVKNFAFIMADNGEWKLTPAYDLTFATGPEGEHSMTILNEGKSSKKRDIQELGKKAGLSSTEINQSMEKVVTAVQKWSEFAQLAGVSEKRGKEINSVIGSNMKSFFDK
jgi:serine/threonine-protein kinase HipA